MQTTLKIDIIIGSTRPGRLGEAVGKWAHDIARKRNDADFQLVDIAQFNLPLLDEPMPAISGQYNQPHTRAAEGPRMGKRHARLDPARTSWTGRGSGEGGAVPGL